MFPLHKETEYERQYSASTPSSRHQSFSHDNVGPSIPSIHRIPSIYLAYLAILEYLR